MQRKKEGNIEWLEFGLFSDIPNLVHASFLRHGGKSSGNFESLNLAYGLGDADNNVSENLKRATATIEKRNLKPAPLKLVLGKQCHKTKVAEITPDSPQETPDCDAFITTFPNIALMIKHADCQAAIIYDPIHHVVANVHAGWRGSVQNVYAKTIQKMATTYGSRPEDLLVGITPSLGPEASEFANYRDELPESFWEFQTQTNHFDFWAISEKQLQDCGVLPHHIEIAKISTYSHPEDFYSFRRDKETGRHGTFVTLRGE